MLTMYRLPRVKQQQPAVIARGGHHALIERVNAEPAHCALVLQHLQRAPALQVVNYHLQRQLYELENRGLKESETKVDEDLLKSEIEFEGETNKGRVDL